MPPDEQGIKNTWLLKLLKLRVWIFDRIHPSEMQVTLVWAGIIGFTGGVASVLFRKLALRAHSLLTGQTTPSLVESFQNLAWWQRLIIPTIGGALAGFTLYMGTRISSRKSSTDYMEAIALGDGTVPARLSLVKCLSALFTISSGGSIGREGPIVQLSAMLASLIGRVRKIPSRQLRLLVACGASAGIASAYNAPIGGAMFVSEIVLCSMSMETFGPLVFSSVVATLTVRNFLGQSPLYEMAKGVGKIDDVAGKLVEQLLSSNWEIIPYIFLGVVAGLAAPWFLRLLRASETWFSKLALPAYLRLALGGLIVGALATRFPETCGNGYSVVNGILQEQYIWYSLLFILVFKLAGTAASFGSGAVGGVFTPTLFVGACLGSLFCAAVQPLWHGAPLAPSAFALVGMGAFLAGTTHAPIMAIIILFEVTLNYEIIPPLMLACVVSHYVSLGFKEKSIYAESLKRKGAADFNRQLASLTVADLMKKDPGTVPEDARFAEIANYFVTHRFTYLYVVDGAQRFKGAISLHDIKNYLNDLDLAGIVIARDIMRDGFPTVAPYDSLAEALGKFSRHDGERLPVTDTNAQLFGTVSKTDVLLALAERGKAAGPGNGACVIVDPHSPAIFALFAIEGTTIFYDARGQIRWTLRHPRQIVFPLVHGSC